MSTHVRSRVVVSLSAAFLILSSATVFAASENRHETIGHMTANAAGVSWQVGADNDRVALTVTGANGLVYSHEFANAHSVNLKLRDLGENPADGSYTYEMRIIPRVSDSVRKQLAAAREKGDDAAAASIMAANGLSQTLVQSGTFTIQNGSFVSSDAVEPGLKDSTSGNKSAMSRKDNDAVSAQSVKALDLVTAQNEEIQGSLCVGFDCVSGESFGFDTIRLKENNTRIKFDDTSTSAGFPNNDWQLTANDSASGGANKFSIEDITGAKVPFTITAAAPTNSMFIDSTGRLGLRTSTPVLDIHVATSNTPAMRLEQNSSGGFTAQTWDVAGNEANFFVRDVTSGSRLPFRIRPGAPTSSIDISATGLVGIGTASPTESLTVTGAVKVSGVTTTVTANTASFDYLSGGARVVAFGSNATTPATFQMVLRSSDASSGTTAMVFDSSARLGLGGVTTPSSPIQNQNGATLSTGGVWTNASSRSLKQDIRDLDTNEAIEALNEMKPVTYAYKVDPTEHHVGFIAEDVPDLVATKDRKGLSAMDVVAVLTSVVKEQQKTIDELKTRLDQVEKKK